MAQVSWIQRTSWENPGPVELVNTQRELLGEAWEALEAMQIVGKVVFKENVQ